MQMNMPNVRMFLAERLEIKHAGRILYDCQEFVATAVIQIGLRFIFGVLLLYYSSKICCYKTIGCFLVNFMDWQLKSSKDSYNKTN